MHLSTLQRLACPICLGALESTLAAPNGSISEVGPTCCSSCGQAFAECQGIPSLIRPERKDELTRFSQTYSNIRRREGWTVSQDPDYYRALPFRDTTGRHSAEWAIRSASFEKLRARISALANGKSLRVIDFGAGCGWLSAQLTKDGHRTLAIDVDVTDGGLLASRHLAGEGTGLDCVQGELRYPPLAPEQADVIVVNAALHYTAEHGEILAKLHRSLAQGGALAILDSPTYRTGYDRAKAWRATEAYYRQLGAPELASTYRGLVRVELDEALRSFSSLESECVMRIPFVRSLIGRLRNGYRPAQFDLVWALK